MRLVAAYLIGLVFGIGISISGMANPAKVLNFFDIAGTWDPSLIFVMGGALIVTALGYRLVLRKPAPILAARFDLPTNRNLDARLLGGAAVFGIGSAPPGQNPAIPQPIPKAAAPPRSRASRLRFVGKSNRAAMIGAEIGRAHV